MIKSKPIITRATAGEPYTARTPKIVEKTNIRPKKGTKFRQSAPHRPTPAKNGPSRRQLQMKRAKDPKANKATIGPNTSTAPSSSHTKTASICLYREEPNIEFTSSPHSGLPQIREQFPEEYTLQRDFLDKLKNFLIAHLRNKRLSQLSHLSDHHRCRGEHIAQKVLYCCASFS